jgi:predicted transcriptional regulator
MTTNKATGRASGVETLKINEKKWSKPVMDAGWSAVPNILIEKQQALGLQPLDINIILHLLHYWWQPDNLPHPSVGTMATAIGVVPRTVQKRVKALEDLGFMKREERRHTATGSTTNLYNFEGLIEKLTPFAKEKTAERQKAKADKDDRIRRKRPRLVVNNDE